MSAKYTEYGIPIRNLWHMLLYAWNEYTASSHWTLGEVEDAPTLDALLASILARLVQQRLRIGLGGSYVDHSQSMRGVRGKIDFSASLRQRSFERGEAVCNYQQYSINAPRNQILRSTLARLVQTGNFGPPSAQADNLRHSLRALTRSLQDIDLIELKLDFIRRQQVHRNDGDYRLMLAICELILQRQMPTEEPGPHPVPTLDREALVLYYVYEQFVANFYRIHLRGYTVRAQSRLSWHSRADHPYLPIMKPDLVLQNQSTGEMLVLDTKFTARSLTENLWGKQIYDSSHLYQMYAYLNTQAPLSEQHRRATGILLYPAIQQESPQRVDLPEHTIRIEYIDLSLPWQAIEQALLDLIFKGGENQ